MYPRESDGNCKQKVRYHVPVNKNSDIMYPKANVRYHLPVNKYQISSICKQKVRYYVSLTRKSDIML